MNDTRENANQFVSDAANMVALLSAIGDTEQQTQRGLATRLNIALGLANAMLRRCVGKGLVKIQSAPARRYAYYLTPKGFAEKSRLVAEYLETSLNFFRKARSQYEEIFSAWHAAGIRRIALAGSGELAEIALLSASAAGVSVVAVIAHGKNVQLFHGCPVVGDAQAAMDAGAEAIVIADSAQPQMLHDSLATHISADRLVAPPLLHVTISATHSAERAA